MSAQEVRESWHRFLVTYEPLRSELYRYCRYLTHSPWDAEDLSQDALGRAFVTLARMGSEPENPRAWLFRVATNLWIDETRRRRELPMEVADLPAPAHEPRAPREAAGTLLSKLSAQERAAVVLKDVFDLSLEETAEAIGTGVGAIKTALHRGRGKLGDETSAPDAPGPAPAVLDEFCAAFNARDIDRLAALLLDTATVEVVGATTLYGPKAARQILGGMLFGSRIMAEAATLGGMEARFVQGVRPDPPRCELRAHRGRWLLVHWYAHADGEAVRAVTLLAPEGDRVAQLRNYFFSPDFIAEVAGELGLPVRVNGYRWFLRLTTKEPS
jgi:RNA polymerase sigma-70 factor (ECF subfamily)